MQLKAKVSAKARTRITTLKKNSNFQQVFEKGHSMNGKYLVVYFLHNHLNYHRFGFCVGRKLGSAVKRNHIKRLLRETVRAVSWQDETGWDIVLVARNSILSAQYQGIISDYEHILLKKGILKQMDNIIIDQGKIKEEGKDSQ